MLRSGQAAACGATVLLRGDFLQRLFRANRCSFAVLFGRPKSRQTMRVANVKTGSKRAHKRGAHFARLAFSKYLLPNFLAGFVGGQLGQLGQLSVNFRPTLSQLLANFHKTFTELLANSCNYSQCPVGAHCCPTGQLSVCSWRARLIPVDLISRAALFSSFLASQLARTGHPKTLSRQKELTKC